MAEKQKDITKALAALNRGAISPVEFDNYLKHGSIDGKPGSIPESKLPSDLKQDYQHQSTAAPGLMGGPGLDWAVNTAKGGLNKLRQAIPAFTNEPSRGINNLLEGAAETAAPGVAIPAIGGAIAAPIAMGVSALGSLAGSKGAEGLASLLKKAGINVSPEQEKVVSNVGGFAGGFAGELGKLTSSELSPVMKKAKLWQENKQAHDEALKTLADHSRDVQLSSEVTLPAAKRAVTEAPLLAQREYDKLAANTPGLKKSAEILGKYAKEDVAAHQRALSQLKDEALRAGKNSYAAQQYDHALEIDKLSNSTIKAQKAAEEAQKALAGTDKEMSAAELAAKKSEVGRLRDVATEAQVKRDALTKGFNENGTVINESPEEKKKIAVQFGAAGKRAANAAADVSSQGLPEPYPHPPSTIRKREELFTTAQEAQQALEAQKDALAAARTAKLSHAKLAADNGRASALPQNDAVDALQNKAEATRAAAREANQAHLDHLDAVAKAKQTAIDAPEMLKPKPRELLRNMMIYFGSNLSCKRRRIS